MAYQGIDKAVRDDASMALDVRGNIMDSCPGPKPKMSLPRVAVLTTVHYVCGRRDGLSRSEAARDCYRDGIKPIH